MLVGAPRTERAAIDFFWSLAVPWQPLASLDGAGRPYWWKPNLAAFRRLIEAGGFDVLRGRSACSSRPVQARVSRPVLGPPSGSLERSKDGAISFGHGSATLMRPCWPDLRGDGAHTCGIAKNCLRAVRQANYALRSRVEAGDVVQLGKAYVVTMSSINVDLSLQIVFAHARFGRHARGLCLNCGSP